MLYPGPIWTPRGRQSPNGAMTRRLEAKQSGAEDEKMAILAAGPLARNAPAYGVWQLPTGERQVTARRIAPPSKTVINAIVTALAAPALVHASLLRGDLLRSQCPHPPRHGGRRSDPLLRRL